MGFLWIPVGLHWIFSWFVLSDKVRSGCVWPPLANAFISPASKVSSIVHGGLAEGRRQDHRRTPSRVHECVQLKRVGYQRRFSQHAGVRAERLVGWSGRWETKTQAGPQRTVQARPNAPSNGVSPKLGEKIRSLAKGPFSPSAPPPVICSPFPAHAKHVTL